MRDAVDIVELASAKTELRRSGADAFKGLCPFHEERTPSFSVSPSKGAYYCFGCQAGGDGFDFVMQTEGVDFAAALELLAERYGIQLELEDEDPKELARRKRRERLLELLERTCSYFERYLWESREAAKARGYLEARGLEPEMLREFRVGYAPSAWDRALVASREGGFTTEELLAAGVAQRSRERAGVYARFRSRITFPLCDLRGHVLGFGARTLSDDVHGPKYLNSPDGEVYHKGHHLFGGQLARSYAATAGATLLCEGYTDVVAMHQAGLRNAVGLMGTALTEQQLAELQRLAPAATLALDADSSGQEAMLRAERLARRRGLELRVAPLPAGSDPAEVYQRDGAGAVRALVESSVPFVRFRVERELAGGVGASAEERDRVLDRVRPLLAELRPGALRLELEQLIATRLSLPERIVTARLVAEPSAKAAAAGEQVGPLDASERTERAFLALCIALPAEGHAALTALDLDAHFTGPLTRRAAEHLRDDPDQGGDAIEYGELRALIAGLSVRAAAEPAQAAELELERLQLELARLEREIVAARTAGQGGLAELAAAHVQLRAAVDQGLAGILDRGE